MTIGEFKNHIGKIGSQTKENTPVYFAVIMNAEMCNDIFEIDRTYLATRPDGDQYVEVILRVLNKNGDKNIGDDRKQGNGG